MGDAIGAGDNLMASGMARGAAARGKRVAFGDGKTIIWDHHSEMIFRGNRNVAAPGSEGSPDLEWIAHYRGHRLYNKQFGSRWLWVVGRENRPGEVFFSAEELRFADRVGGGFVLIEPNVPNWKSCTPNKQWPLDRFDKVAKYLRKDGYEVCQFLYGSGHQLPGARMIKTPSFRHALAALARASLYIGPEGGLHHGAAAVDVAAVVLFGGFIPPGATGYQSHANLTGGAQACGSLQKCEHCRAAMDAISIEAVHAAALEKLGGLRSERSEGLVGSMV